MFLDSIIQKKYKLLLLGLFISMSSSGQKWTNYSTASTSDLICNNDVHSIVSDNIGNTWFGTSGGVSKYDGNSWTTYTTDDGLINNHVNVIVIDSQKNLWFGTNGGISKFDGNKWTSYNITDGLVDNCVNAIAIDSLGNLWVGCGNMLKRRGGVCKFNGKTWTKYTNSNGLISKCVTSLAIDSKGNIWGGVFDDIMWGGVSRYDGKAWKDYIESNGLGCSNVNSLITDNKGNVWAGGAGLSKFDGVTWTNYHPTIDIHTLYVDCDGSLWYGGDDFQHSLGVISKFDGINWIDKTPNNLQNVVNTMFFDSNGNKWFGTNGGALKFNGTSWINFAPNGLISNVINDIAIDDKGNKWFATNDGVSMFDGVKWTNYTNANGLSHVCVNEIAIDAIGDKWFGTNFGVSKLHDSIWSYYPMIDYSNSKSKIIGIAFDSNGLVWLTSTYGLGYIDGNNSVDYHWLVFSATKLGEIAFDHQNYGWTVTSLGLVRVPSQSLINTPYYGYEGYTIVVDSLDNKWYGSGLGVSMYNNISWINYNTSNGLVNDTVLSIVIDKKGCKWFGTKQGISKYDGIKWTTYNVAKGLISNVVNSIAEDNQGTKWFGTNEGVSELNENIKVKLDQTITFPALQETTYGSAPFFLEATASSGLSVTYKSSNNSVATISENSVTITGAGITDIIAYQSGDDEYNAAASVTQTLTVSLPSRIPGSSLPIVLHPNPTFNFIVIKGIDHDSVLQMFDSKGQMLKICIFDNSILDISSLPSGLYYLKIADTIHKIIKL